jgi:hypothetical protein
MQGPGHLSSRSEGLPVVGRPPGNCAWPKLPASAGKRAACPTLALVSLLVLCGCRTTHVLSADAAGAPQYESLRLVYDLVEPAIRTAGGEAPLDLETAKARPVRAWLVSRQSSPEVFQSRPVRRLAIDYPCDEVDGDRALVRIAEPTADEGPWQEIARRTLSREELDLLFVHLVNGGLCDSETHLNGGTRIAVEVDGTAIEKPWNREPRLDRLAAETYDACR